MWSMALRLGAWRKSDRMIVPPRVSKFQVCQICFWWVFWGAQISHPSRIQVYILYIYTLYIWNPNGSPCFVWSVCLGLGKRRPLKNWLVMAGLQMQKKTWGDPCDSANGQPYLFHPLIYTSGGIYCVFSLTQWPTFRLLVIPYQGVIKFPFFGGIKQYKSRVILRDDFPTMHGLGW